MDLQGDDGEYLAAEGVELLQVRPAPEDQYDAPGHAGRALVPIDTAGICMSSDRSSLMWVRVLIPRDARPGTYRGRIHFHAEGRQIGHLPLTLQVHKPALADVGQWGRGVEVWQSWMLLGHHHDIEPFTEQWWGLADEYLASLASLGVNVIQVGRGFFDWRRVARGQWQFDFSRFDRFLRMCRQHGLGARISYLGMFSTSGPTQLHYLDADGELQVVDASPGDDIYDEAWSAFAEALARRRSHAELTTELHVWPADRPRDDEQIARFIAAAELLRGADSEFRIAVNVEEPHTARQLAADTDRLALPLRGKGSPEPALVAELKATDKQVWGYLEHGAAVPGLAAGLPPSHAYAVGLLAHRVQLDGMVIASHVGRAEVNGAEEPHEALGKAMLAYTEPHRLLRSLEAERWFLGLQDAELLRMTPPHLADQWLAELAVDDNWKALAEHAPLLRHRALTHLGDCTETCP